MFKSDVKIWTAFTLSQNFNLIQTLELEYTILQIQFIRKHHRFKAQFYFFFFPKGFYNKVVKCVGQVLRLADFQSLYIQNYNNSRSVMRLEVSWNFLKW